MFGLNHPWRPLPFSLQGGSQGVTPVHDSWAPKHRGLVGHRRTPKVNHRGFCRSFSVVEKKKYNPFMQIRRDIWVVMGPKFCEQACSSFFLIHDYNYTLCVNGCHIIFFLQAPRIGSVKWAVADWATWTRMTRPWALTRDP